MALLVRNIIMVLFVTENYDGVKNYDNVSGGGHGREYYGSDG